MIEPTTKLRWFQFSLLQLLIGVTLLAFVLAAGRWLYLPTVLKREDQLSQYGGKWVSFVAKVGRTYPEHGWAEVYFGATIVDAHWSDMRVGKPPKTGETILVTGILYLPREAGLEYTLVGATWRRE